MVAESPALSAPSAPPNESAPPAAQPGRPPRRAVGLRRAIGLLIAVALAPFVVDRVLEFRGVPGRMVLQAGHPAFADHEVTALEFSHRFQTNDRGLRDRTIPLQAQPHERRVLLLGDSFTEGYGVEEPDCFAALLERGASERGRETVFLNGGLRATGPVQQAQLLTSVGFAYSPSVVLLCVYANDVYDVPPDAVASDIHPSPPEFGGARGFVHRTWPHLHHATAHLWPESTARARVRRAGFLEFVRTEARERSIPKERVDAWCDAVPDFLLRAVDEGKFNGTVLGSGLVVPDYWRQCLDVAGTDAERKWEAMTTVLAALREACAERGVALGIAFLPSALQYDPAFHDPANLAVQLGPERRAEWLEGATEVQRRLAAWCDAQGLPFHDLTEAFRSARASLDPEVQLNWPLDGHWTPDGHRVAADALGAWIQAEPAFDALRR